MLTVSPLTWYRSTLSQECITEKRNYLRKDCILWYGYEDRNTELSKYSNAHTEKDYSLQAVAEGKQDALVL